jgi:hypothetical protein
MLPASLFAIAAASTATVGSSHTAATAVAGMLRKLSDAIAREVEVLHQKALELYNFAGATAACAGAAVPIEQH